MNASMTGGGFGGENPRGLLAKIGQAAGLSPDGKNFQANAIPVIQVQKKLTDRVVRPESKEDLALMRNLLSALKNNTLRKIENCARASNLDSTDNQTVCKKCSEGYSPINRGTQCAPSCVDQQCNPNYVCLKEKKRDTSGGCVAIPKKIYFCESLESTLLQNLGKPKCAYCQAHYVLVKNSCIKSCDCQAGKICKDCGKSGFCDLTVQKNSQGFCRVLSKVQTMKNCKNY